MSKIPVINVNMTNNFYMFNCIVGTNKFQINCLDAFSNNLFQHYLPSSLNLLNNFILPGMQLLSYIYIYKMYYLFILLHQTLDSEPYHLLPPSHFVCPLFHFGMSQNIVLFLKIKVIKLLMFLLYPY